MDKNHAFLLLYCSWLIFTRRQS